MAHKDMKEDKGYIVKNVTIKRADDNSFIYEVHAEKIGDGNSPMDYHTYTYTFDNVDDIAEALEDDLMTPHPKVKKEKSMLDKEINRGKRKKPDLKQVARKY